MVLSFQLGGDSYLRRALKNCFFWSGVCKGMERARGSHVQQGYLADGLRLGLEKLQREDNSRSVEEN